MSLVHTAVVATFMSGLLMAIGVTHHQTAKQIQQEKQAQIAKIQAQNKAMCNQLRIHHVKPPKGVTC